MKSASKEVSVKQYKSCTLHLDDYDVDLVDPESAEPVCITLTSVDGKRFEVHMSPPEADAFGRKVVAQAAAGLTRWRPKL